MVIKTEPCFFTDLKVYPGKGRRFVRKDSKLLVFISQKARSLYTQRKRAQVLRWTQQWRKKNKKTKAETIAKKKGRRSARVFRAVVGLSLEDLKKKREATTDFRKAQRDASLREVKERSRKAKEEKKKASTYTKGGKTGGKAAPAGSAAFTKVPKSRRVAVNQKVGAKR